MFAKTIIDSDLFLDMPATAQLLYFHLGMRADDDGFINNPKRIMRDIRCSDDDLKMPIDFNDDKAVQAMFKQFTDNVVANAKKEYAIVVSKSNRSFWLEGGNSTVDITRAGKELYGAKVIHNHPDYLGLPADSFSIDDVEYLIEYNLEYLEVATNLGRFRVRYVGKPITVQDMYLAYKEAYNKVIDRCIASDIVSEYNQLDTMRLLPKVLEGVIFEEL